MSGEWNPRLPREIAAQVIEVGGRDQRHGAFFSSPVTGDFRLSCTQEQARQLAGHLYLWVVVTSNEGKVVSWRPLVGGL